MFDLKGKKALVTGSTQGIGFAAAEVLAEYGATVYINGASSMEKVMAAVKRINRDNAKPAFCDLSDALTAEKLFEITGPVDILISNASVQVRKSWDDITEEEMERQINLNFKAAYRLIKKYAPYMKENNWGRIITVGSVQETKPHKDMLIYAAMKAAQTNMVVNLAKQLAPFGITVNNIAPGVIETPRNFDALSDLEYKQKVLAGIPAGFPGKVDDCKGQILLLSSDEGRYITGENIYIDGGMKL